VPRSTKRIIGFSDALLTQPIDRSSQLALRIGNKGEGMTEAEQDRQ